MYRVFINSSLVWHTLFLSKYLLNFLMSDLLGLKQEGYFSVGVSYSEFAGFFLWSMDFLHFDLTWNPLSLYVVNRQWTWRRFKNYNGQAINMNSHGNALEKIANSILKCSETELWLTLWLTKTDDYFSFCG